MLYMKNSKILLSLILLAISISSFSQQSEEDTQKGKFKNENIFVGSGINLGFTSNSYNVGINPEIGYSITKWIDAGISLNFNYFKQNASNYSTYSYSNLNYGGGTFLRIWPVNFFNLQIQPEYNWVSSNQRNVFTNQSENIHYNAGSLLVGVGYGTRVMGKNYSYVTLMIDVLQNQNSPYRDQYNDPLPVFRAGFGIYLQPKQR